MASSAISILSGIAAAAAGFSGEKVEKTGSIPGLDLASIVPALLGGGTKAGSSGAVGKIATVANVAAKSGLLNANNIGKIANVASAASKSGLVNASSIGKIANVASAASKSGLVNASNIGKIADLATGLISISSGKKANAKTPAKAAEKDGIAGLAAKIMGGTGSAANLASIATLAASLAKPANDDKKELTCLASELGKALNSNCGVSFGGAGTAISALSKSLGKDTQCQLFTSILKGLSK